VALDTADQFQQGVGDFGVTLRSEMRVDREIVFAAEFGHDVEQMEIVPRLKPRVVPDSGH
jgi:hypothetical protein